MKKLFLLLITMLLSFSLISCSTNEVSNSDKDNVVIPMIGENGNWWIGENDTGIKASGENGKDGENGEDGKDGIAPTISINADGYWVINDVVSDVKARGEDGKDGSNGDNGTAPTIEIDHDGYWIINGVNSGVLAKGQDGQNGKDGITPTIKIDSNGYWVINGVRTDYKAEGDNDAIKKALEYQFNYKNIFVKETATQKNPIWSYTTSTFSGWGGSIGKPNKIDTLSMKFRARKDSISKVKLFITENDKNGKLITSTTLDVNVEPYSEYRVIWNLDNKIINNTSPLYFAFNCDALIDVYSSYGKSDLIPENEYQAVSTYTTSGRILDDLTKMTDVYNTPCYYQYVELGYCDYVYELKDEFNISNKIVVNLASEYALAVNDNFQLFYRGVIEAVNPYNYGIEVKCSKGSQYPRYYEWTPTISDLGRYSLILNVYDNNGQLLGSDKTMLKVYDPLKTNEKQNILCFGDSLTAGGTWVKEAARRYISSNGKPAGLGLDYLNFVGGKKMNFDGKEVGYEGTGGWTWATYLGESSPFYNPATKTIDFKYYTNKIGVTTLDECYILLTWNGMGTPYKKDFILNEGHFKQAQVLIDQLHKDYPACKVRLMGLQMPSQNGGMGTNYGATGGYSSAYGMLVTAMNYNKTLEKLCMSDKYKDFTKFIDIAAQFDTDYNMPSTSKPVNNRSDVTEIIGTNGVHPSVNGYYQIADAVFRSLCRDYASNEVL